MNLTNRIGKIGLISIAAALSIGAAAFAPRIVSVPEKLRSRLKSFETSAGIYLADLDRYLIASDDTTKNDDPWLFLMDAAGRVDPSPVEISGLRRMTDIESISQENGILYIHSSLGLNKNGENRKERNLFVRATREGRKIFATNAIELREPLLEAIRTSEDQTLQKLRRRVDADLDVESSMVRDGILYVGLKNPQPRPGVALILTLGKVARLFTEARVSEVEVYAVIDFGAVTGDSDTLSDMDYREGAFFLTTTTEGRVGRFWRFDPRSGKLLLLKEYPRLNPEAVMGAGTGKSLILFDQGEDEALFSFEANGRR